jgi:hypothetical protein
MSCISLDACFTPLLYFTSSADQVVTRTFHNCSFIWIGPMQVKVFQQDHYLANFVQSTFDSLPSAKVKGVALIPQTQSNPMQRSDDRVLALIADCRDHLTIWILYMLNCVLI